jgi:peptide/nickel transport system permease protein
VSAHPLWIGLVLSYVFGYRLQWTPIGSYCSVFDPTETCGGPVQWAYHLLLPWVAFGAVFAAIYARMIRASVLEVYDADHVRTARALGMSEARILRTQVLRNAMLPLVTMLGMDLGIAFGGAIFVERAFGLPGVGKLLISSLGGRDLPVTLGIVVLVTTAILVFNLLVDLLYPLLDPRIGVGGSQSAKARSKWLRGRAPTTVVLGSPPSNRITVGSERTP